MPLSVNDLQPQLDRRRPGANSLGTPRKEADQVQILSGVENGITLGTPIGLLILNEDQRPGDYSKMRDVPRPSHADYTYLKKYGTAASSGGGRASARETAARVAAGALAEKWLQTSYGTRVTAWVSSIAEIDIPDLSATPPSREQIDQTDVRCPVPEAAEEMTKWIQQCRSDGDSCGGIITCVVTDVPAGWGEPVFDKAEAVLSQAMMSLPATKGIEFGSGFHGTRLRGSDHNDVFVAHGHELSTATNRSGGIQGGITNGENIVFRVAFKPPATIASIQKTADYQGKTVDFRGTGRHDPCVLPRAVPIVETMAALVLADLALRQAARQPR
jgi:chorismate synthase